MKYMLETRLIIHTKKEEQKTARDKLYHQLTPTFAPVPSTLVLEKKNTNDERICSTINTLVDDEEAWLTVLSNTCWCAACRQRPENSVPQLSLVFFFLFLEGMAKNSLILEMFRNPVSLLWLGPRVVVTVLAYTKCQLTRKAKNKDFLRQCMNEMRHFKLPRPVQHLSLQFSVRE